MTQIFISYSRVDKGIVERLVKRIEQAFPDLTLWYDTSPHALVGGDNWWDEILKAIDKSDIFVYVLSNESVKSLFCQAEFTEARRLQKRIVTIQARDRTERTEDLDELQWIDMRYGTDDADALQQITAAIRKQLSLAKKKRPLWKPATPKPGKDPPSTRTANDPDITTPPLAVPTVELQALHIAKQNLRYQIVSVVIAIVAISFTVVVWLIDRNDGSLADVSVKSPEQLALTGVIRNADWTPYARDFDGVTMMLVPAGCFMMGSNDGDSDEQPVHEQCFDRPFWIDKTEVANGQFDRFEGYANSPSWGTGVSRPREQISWFEAADFCELRGAHLPTEQEWEYAARGPDGLTYPWGSLFNSSYIVYSGSSGGRTSPVGSKLAGSSWVGALDMSGNVWEWVSSPYRLYPYTTSHENRDNTSMLRVLRGGAWDSSQQSTRSSNRGKIAPFNKSKEYGFRCAHDFE